ACQQITDRAPSRQPWSTQPREPHPVHRRPGLLDRLNKFVGSVAHYPCVKFVPVKVAHQVEQRALPASHDVRRMNKHDRRPFVGAIGAGHAMRSYSTWSSAAALVTSKRTAVRRPSSATCLRRTG